MSANHKHLVFYDGECGFCDQVVQFLLKVDRKEQFLFAPLQGKTAAKVLQKLPDQYKQVDSLVLVENYATNKQHFYVLGKASFRILWLLGGSWRLLGWICFLPSFLYNWGYRLVARNRKKLMPEACILPDPKSQDRFLP